MGILLCLGKQRNCKIKSIYLMEKRLYLSPQVTFTEVEQEGLICASPVFNVKVKELDHVNDYEGDVAPEDFYFKS